MYNYDYEADVLLFLRLAKYLHSQNPAALEKILEMYVDFDLAFLFELCESIIGKSAPMQCLIRKRNVRLRSVLSAIR